jgi:predicted nucleic acid-binding protein
LGQFLDAPRIRLLNINDETAQFYAATLDSLKKAGRRIPTNDIWIGAVALQNGCRCSQRTSILNGFQG